MPVYFSSSLLLHSSNEVHGILKARPVHFASVHLIIVSVPAGKINGAAIAQSNITMSALYMRAQIVGFFEFSITRYISTTRYTTTKYSTFNRCLFKAVNPSI